jgi:hypothetical protein
MTKFNPGRKNPVAEAEMSLDRLGVDHVDGIHIPLRPSMGVYAVEPEGEEPVSAILAGAYGGNLDLWELTEGTSLFLPVFKPGARVWTGDANAPIPTASWTRAASSPQWRSSASSTASTGAHPGRTDDRDSRELDRDGVRRLSR